MERPEVARGPAPEEKADAIARGALRSAGLEDAKISRVLVDTVASTIESFRAKFARKIAAPADRTRIEREIAEEVARLWRDYFLDVGKLRVEFRERAEREGGNVVFEAQDAIKAATDRHHKKTREALRSLGAALLPGLSTQELNAFAEIGY